MGVVGVDVVLWILFLLRLYRRGEGEESGSLCDQPASRPLLYLPVWLTFLQYYIPELPPFPKH